MQVILALSCIAVGLLMVDSVNCHVMIRLPERRLATRSKKNQTFLCLVTSNPLLLTARARQ